MRWLGSLSTLMAMLVVLAGALLGVVFTLMAGQEPGGLLGFFVIMGSIAAALGIRHGKVHLLFPAPALAFFVAAILTGKVHDSQLGSSTAGLAAGFTQWVAGIFFPAVVATILVLLIGGGRWLLGRQLVTSQSLPPPRSPAPGKARPAAGKARPAPGTRRPARSDPDRDDWADDNPFADQQAFQTQITPAVREDRPARTDGPGGGAPRPARPPRDPGQRTDRDQRGNSGPAPDRGQSADPRPRPSPQPRDRAPRPSFNPNPKPGPRPQRPQRPEGWKPR